MKMIKVSDEVHKLVLPHTTNNGKKKTMSDVIKDRFAEMPNANFRDIEIDDYMGQILISDFYISENDANPNNICAEISIIIDFDNKNSQITSWDVLNNAKLIEFKYLLREEMYLLKCDNFITDLHMGNKHGDVIVMSLFISDYKQYSKKISKDIKRGTNEKCNEC